MMIKLLGIFINFRIFLRLKSFSSLTMSNAQLLFHNDYFFWDRLFQILNNDNGLVVKMLDSQSKDPVLKTIGWLSLSSFWGR